MSSLFQTAIALCQIDRYGDTAAIWLPQETLVVAIDGQQTVVQPLQLLRWLTCPASHNAALNWRQINRVGSAIVIVDEKVQMQLP
jgi:hypothetical protein